VNLGEYLKRSGLSRTEFAEMVGVAEASMSRYVAGKRVPRPGILRRIVAASGGEVRADDFFADADAGAAGTAATAAPGNTATTAPRDPAAAFRAAHPEIAAVDMLLCDMHGMLRGKRLAAGSLSKLFSGGVMMPGSTFALDVTGANVDATGTGMADGDPDYVCRPVAGTLVTVPWAARPAAQVLASMYHHDGRPFHLDPRHVLGRVAARFEELGLRPVVALELEFYLLDRERDAAGRPQPPVSPATGRRATDTQVFAIDDLEDASPVLDDIAQACAAQSIPASVALAEYAPAQYEINLKHRPDPVAAGDHAVLLKRAVKGVARRHGLEATFMAKPFAELSANGLHIHVSLLDRDGRNAFDDAKDGGEERLRHAIGGLRATMAEAMAIFAPNANSYRRYRPGTYAPLAPTWGYDNRTVALRVPAARGAASRIEHRTAGADANPYLAAAAVLAGIHHGLARGLDPGPPTTGNAYEQHAASLPSHWLDALRAFDRAGVLAEYLGADYCRVYLACKWRELEMFNARVTPTEYDWYLRAL
jgi:glutamine synthetase